jgi:hypothetical protein
MFLYQLILLLYIDADTISIFPSWLRSEGTIEIDPLILEDIICGAKLPLPLFSNQVIELFSIEEYKISIFPSPLISEEWRDKIPLSPI